MNQDNLEKNFGPIYFVADYPQLDLSNLDHYLNLIDQVGRVAIQELKQQTVYSRVLMQIRAKKLSEKDFLALVTQAAAIFPDNNEIALILNDRVNCYKQAKSTGLAVAGIHLGQSDGDPILLRKQLAKETIIGLSATNPQQLCITPGVVDYHGVGPVFATLTKPDHAPPIAPAGLLPFIASTSSPLYAIGGINLVNLETIKTTKIYGIAVVSTVASASNPGMVYKELLQTWTK